MGESKERKREKIRKAALFFCASGSGVSEGVQEFSEDGVRRTSMVCSWMSLAKKRREWKRFIKGVAPYPEIFCGRGIVTCAGGPSYFTCAWVSISLLRKSGCRLPIEVWHQEGELNQETIRELQRLDVVCRCFSDYTGEKISNPYQLKPLALLHSSFKEILYLDADNTCLGNPAYLFEHPLYKSNGAVFWPDYWQTATSNPIWKIVDSQANEGQEQESGQLLINKEQCWKELNLCLFFNLNPFYYQILWGDKDTFRFAWLALRSPFHMIEQEVAALGFQDGEAGFGSIAMLQHDYGGTPVFVHSNLLKWDSRPAGQRFWKEVRRLNPELAQRKVKMKYHPRFDSYLLSLEGEAETIAEESSIARLEGESLEILQELRNSAFYVRFLRGSERKVSLS